MGDNRLGELGIPIGRERWHPRIVEGLGDMVELSGAGGTFCARDREGRVACWGEHAGIAEGDDGPRDRPVHATVPTSKA
ncbi:MAG: hypothetical protein GWN07_37155, partial [Actinobacteria bacterium]|nr:hypothetical protein [Actinomycetota bacterium]